MAFALSPSRIQHNGICRIDPTPEYCAGRAEVSTSAGVRLSILRPCRLKADTEHSCMARGAAVRHARDPVIQQHRGIQIVPGRPAFDEELASVRQTFAVALQPG